MKAMILAAGFGTRLRPLTDNIPKALVPVKGTPMINYQIERLKYAGADEIIINVHHHAEIMIKYFEENNFGVKITVINEDTILGTGGAVVNARKYLENEEFFILMNADIDTSLELKELIDFHIEHKPFATVAVQKRKTNRHVELNDKMHMQKRADDMTDDEDKYAFNGIHVISEEFFKQDLPDGFSDIIDIYIECIMDGKIILGYDMLEHTFKDLGKIEDFQ